MHAVIVGAGDIGRSLARWLLSSGQEVAVVDRDQEVCAATQAELGGIVVQGDASKADVLAKAGAGRAGVLIAVTASAATNLVACQMARHRFGVESTVGIVEREEHTRLFNLAGIDSAINSTELISRRIQESLPLEGLVNLMQISGAARSVMVAIHVPAASSAVGTKIRDLPIPPGTVIPLIIARDGGTTIPDDETVLNHNDQVVAVTGQDQLDRLRDVLGWQTEDY